MESAENPSRHCYSMRLVRPFLAFLREQPGFPVALLAPLEAMDVDERIPIPTLLELLRGAIALTGDADIGLKAARKIELGDYGALEYAASSAGTVRQAFDVIGRYLGLINDALEMHIEVQEGKARICLDSALVLSRAPADFQSAAFYITTTQHHALPSKPAVEVWFTHPAPQDGSEYARTFPGETVRFDMPMNAFVMDASVLDQPLTSADQKLHELISKHAELMLAELPKAQSFTESVRELIAGELSGGNPSVAHVAKNLHMSSRTLARRLEEEGTTFKALLDDLRRRLALRHIGGQDLDISEVAFLLGFSESSAFYRAFRRWTGQTPLAYRRARR